MPSGAKIVNAAGEDVTGDYEITYREGTLNVTQKPLTITADSAIKTYDGTPLTKETFTSTELAEGDSIESVTVTGSQTEVGRSDNVPSGAKIVNEAGEEVTDCYQINYRNGILQVTDRKVVTVTAKDASKVYGAKDPELTAAVSGVEGTDTLEYTVTRAAGEDAGSYVITPAGDTEQGIYAVTYVTGTFTIKKAPSSGTVTAKTGLVYTGSAQELVIPGEVTGGTLEYALGENEKTAPASGWSEKIPAGTEAGTYYVWYRVKGDKNHTDTEAACVKATVTGDLAVTVTAKDASKVYGEKDPELTADVTGLQGGDTVSYTLAREEGEDAGTYAITATGEKVQGPYTVSYVTGTFTIEKAEPALTAPKAKEGLVADGTAQELVEAGTATGGTLKYALGTDDRTAPAEGWEEKIPTGTEAGTYYVWYRAEGDRNHLDTAPACVTVKMEETGEKTKPKGRLRTKARTKGEHGMTVSWEAAEGADGYDVFLSKCDGKGDDDACKNLYKTLPAGKTGITIKRLKKGVSYKVCVRAFVLKKDGSKEYGKDKQTVHLIAGGSMGKYTNVVSVKPNKKKITLAVGEEKKAKAKITGEVKGKQFLDHGGAIRYRSSDEKVATVTADGKVKGKKPGTCTIEIIAASGVRGTVEITVKAGPSRIWFEKKSYALKLTDKKMDLKALLQVEAPEDYRLVLKWQSSNTGIAKVNKKGIVTAIQKGTVTITVISSNRKKTTVKIRIK